MVVIVTSGMEGGMGVWAERMDTQRRRLGEWGHHSKGDLLRFDVHILGVDMRALHCSLMLTDSFMCY